MQLPTDDLIRQTPPILLRVSFADESLDDTTPQFLTYGWTRGVSNFLTDGIDHVIRSAVDRPGHWTTGRYTLKLPSAVDLTLTAVQIMSHPELTYRGPLLLALFFPEDIELPDEKGLTSPAVCRSTGGPSQEYLALLKTIAILLECRVSTIETHVDGSTLALLRPWSKHYSLEEATDRQSGSRTNESMDGSNEPMAGSEGS